MKTKIIGIIVLLFSSSTYGFVLADSLKKREKALLYVVECLKELKNRIRLESGEINGLLKKSFTNSSILNISEEMRVNSNWLKQGDIDIINEYFKNAGMSDIYAECDRLDLYISLIESRYESAKEESGRLCRLYRTLGFLCGAFIGIMLL